MNDHERISRFRTDFGSVGTPVEDVMTRGRALRLRRRRIVSGSVVVSTIAAVFGVFFGVGAFNSGRTGEVQIAASPSASSEAAEATVPVGVACVSALDTKPLVGSGPSVSAQNLPLGLQLESSVGSSATNCAVPRVAAVLSAATAGGGKIAVALWGPGALATPLTADSGIPAPEVEAPVQVVSVHGQTGRLVVTTASRTELSWREANGSAWVLTGNGLSPADFGRLANAFNVDQPAHVTLTDAAAFGLQADPPQSFPAAGTTATTWRTRYANGAEGLNITIVDNGVQATGSLAAALQPTASQTFTTVNGHPAAAGSNSANFSSITWAESPTRTVTVSGTYSTVQITAIANGLVIR